MRLTDIRLQWLQYFMEVAELKNFTKVAEKCFTSQSNVSYAIKSLEKTMGVLLFDRRDNEITLSIYGEKFLPYVKEAFNQLDCGCKMIDDLVNPFSGEVRIGFSSVYSKSFIPDLYKYLYEDFRKNGYNIRIRSVMAHVDDDLRRVEDLLLDGDCDLAFAGIRTRKGLDHTKVHTVGRVVLLPKDHPLANESSVTLEQLKTEPFILLDGDKSDLNYYGRLFESVGIEPNVIGYGYGLTYILLQVAAGHCLSIVPQGKYSDLDVAAVYLDHPMSERDIYLVTHAQPNFSNATAYTKKLIMKYFKTRHIC